MSDSNDKGSTESPADFDFDSTVQLDLSKYTNATPGSVDEGAIDDDFDKTINGLMEIDDLLKEEAESVSRPEQQDSSSSSEAIDFDELNAGIEALTEDFTLSSEEDDGSLTGNEFLPENSEQREESDDMFDLDISDLPDDNSSDDENEFMVKEKTEITQELPILETGDSDTSEEDQAVIELTEEMLDEPEVVADQPEEEEMFETSDDQAVQELAEELDTSELDTPELSTTENEFLSEAVKEAAAEVDHKDEIPEIEVEEIEVEEVAAPQPEVSANEATSNQVTEPVADNRSGGSNMIPVLFGILGMAVGGFGAWTANDASVKIADLERQIQTLSATGGDSNNRDLADIQQRLGKVERRLTGTPTIEAAAPLGTSSTPVKQQEPAKPAAAKPAMITPETPVSNSGTTDAVWVVNLSSHAKENLAANEQARLSRLGLNAEVHTAQIKGRTWYRVQITGFASKDEAKAKLKDVQQRSGVNGAWIGKR